MGHFIDLTGKKFDRLSVLGRVPVPKESNGRTRVRWLCKCECGENKIVPGDDLKSGHTRSCGCIHREQLAERNTTHGLGKPASYDVWAGMVQRCTNPSNPSYGDYGGRGITVCDEWLSFDRFARDMGERPAGTSIERDDVNGNYEPANCRWATAHEQVRNTRRNINLTHDGRTMCLMDWAQAVGIEWTTLYARISRLGWSAEKALTTPVDTRKGPRKRS